MRRNRQNAAFETPAVARWVAVWLWAGLAIVARDAAAEPSPEASTSPAPLCAGCVLEGAARPGPAPLVVLLHGDGESAPARAAMWRRWLRPRGFSLLSLACPAALGCKGSFWRWDGDPAWLDAQVEAAARRIAVDRDRVFLIGWSGGASYMGWRVHALPRSFAALVFHGGGMAPARGDDGRPLRCDSAPRPALFLVGDKNPLHHLAQSLQKSLLACQHAITWRLLPGADHEGERAALGDPKKVTEVLDWLQSHPRGQAASQSSQ